MKKDELIDVIEKVENEVGILNNIEELTADKKKKYFKIFIEVYNTVIDTVSERMYVMKKMYNEVFLDPKRLIPPSSEIIKKIKDKLNDENEVIYAFEVSVFLRTLLKITLEPTFVTSKHISNFWYEISDAFERKLINDEGDYNKMYT